MKLYSLIKSLFSRRPAVSLEQIPYLAPGATRLTTAAIERRWKFADDLAEDGLLDPDFEYQHLSEYAYLVRDTCHAGRDLHWLQ